MFAGVCDYVISKPEADLLAAESARCLPPFYTPWRNLSWLLCSNRHVQFT